MPPRSTPGEGIVIIVDVSPNVRASTDVTFYSQSKKCLINILQRKIFAEKCKDMVGIVLLGTDTTKNNLANNNQYQNITVLEDPKYVDWELISRVEQLPRGNHQGDWLDALVVAMDLLHDPDGINFSNKKIVLMTDFNTEFSDDQVEKIITGLRSMEIDLSVIGPSLSSDDDMVDGMDNAPSTSSNGYQKPNLNWNGKIKSNQQLAAEAVIKRIVAEVDGIICDFDEAIPQLIFFEKKSQGSANWNAMLDIGPNFIIPITGKIKIKHATPASWKKLYIEDETAAVINETSYHKKDETQTVVDERDIISGYKYGTTLVPFVDDDAQLKYSCEVDRASLSVLGFTSALNVPLNLRAGDQVLVITAKDVDEDGSVALSALIQALSELNMVAITRRVYRKGLNPVLGALYPDISTKYECLIWVGLPFQEDVRNFSFPSLEKKLENITKEQRDVVDSLISTMDLSAEDPDDEELNPTQLVNPQLQHHFNCLTHRALYPDEPLQDAQQHILDLLAVPDKLKEGRDILASKLSQLFPTKKEEKKTKKKQDLFDNTPGQIASTSNGTGDVTSNCLLGTVVTKISTVTPVEDFRTLLQGEQPNYNEICCQMEGVILQFTESLSGNDDSEDRILVNKLIDCLKAFREELSIIDPSPYNSMMQQLKSVVVARNFNRIWLIIQQDGLGLITGNETLKSTVTEEEANKFIQLDSGNENEANVPANDNYNYDDMLDDL